VLIEINEEGLAEGIGGCHGIVAVLCRARIELPQLLHGRDATMWPFYREALRLGLDGRIGLEDGKHCPPVRKPAATQH